MTTKKLSMDMFLAGAQANPGRIIVPAADNLEALEAVGMALQDGVVRGGALIGHRGAVTQMAAELGLSLEKFELIDIADHVAACDLAARMLAEGKGDFLLKGQCDTKVYMRSILTRELGLVPEGHTLCQVGIMELPTYHKLLIMTDAGITIRPDANEKMHLVQNVVDVCHGLGIQRPKVAMISAVEKLNHKMPSTVHAVEVVRRCREGEIKDCVVEGPYDLYIATSAEAAKIKQVEGEVCGDADVLVFPALTAANVFYKTVSHFVPGVRIASLIAGAKFPIILPSRADPAETKRMSIIAAAYFKPKAA